MSNRSARHANSFVSIHNLRRRVAGLPAASEEDYDAQVKSPKSSHQHKDSSEEQDRKQTMSDKETDYISRATSTTTVHDEVPTPTQCLFCNVNSPRLHANLEHMASSHGLFIPSPDRISDVEAFLSYVAVIVFKYNECLYCGVEKASVDAVQTHMRDKGHCKLNLHSSSELLDFWDDADSSGLEDGSVPMEHQDNVKKLSATEMRLPSGLVITSSQHTDTTRLHANSRIRNRIDRSTSPSSTLTTSQASGSLTPQLPRHNADPHDSRRLATRHTMGLAGVSESQLRTLAAQEKRSRTLEGAKKNRVRHAMEQQPMKTMYYKTENPVYQAG
jgi:pre-60S factor REI1